MISKDLRPYEGFRETINNFIGLSSRAHEASLKEKFRELDYLREGQIALSESMRGQLDIARLDQSS